jgi:hypothetical protein
MNRFTLGGKCVCGNQLPNVLITETPYQYCSSACKEIAAQLEALKDTRIACNKCQTWHEPKMHIKKTRFGSLADLKELSKV